ncbi:hypothetical protein P1A02_21350, partial [Xanthomonas hortorum pv. gardneri]|uniref:hypothetical protein n=1 Tax=Xanthomonas hortorum TaxID=56454 RepID=UPI0039834E1B
LRASHPEQGATAHCSPGAMAAGRSTMAFSRGTVVGARTSRKPPMRHLERLSVDDRLAGVTARDEMPLRH